MKLAYSAFEHVFDFSEGCLNTLIIENRQLFRRFIEDAVAQMNNEPGEIILSCNNKPVEFSKYADLISSPVPFEINRKPLLTKIISSLERIAIGESYFMDTQALLIDIEKYVMDISFRAPCSLHCTKLTVSNLLKGVGVEIADDYSDTLEKILDYMQLVREYDRDRVFIFVNMRSYFEDYELNEFVKTALENNFQILLLDGDAHTQLDNERRVIIDNDLCEI